MSWSATGIGRPNKVAEKLYGDLLAVECSEPEETIKKLVAEIIVQALAVYPPGYAVKVAASGSQYVPDHTKPGEASNQLTVVIEPLYGFIA